MQAAANGQTDPVIADGAFHDAVIAAGNNRFLLPFGAMIRRALFVTAIAISATRLLGDLAAHRRILAAIERSAVAEAHDAIQKMLTQVLEAVAFIHDREDVVLKVPSRREVAVTTQFELA